MNDEINKILDNIKNKYDSYLVCDIVSGDDLKLLLVYINKLQSNWNSLREIIKDCNKRYEDSNIELNDTYKYYLNSPLPPRYTMNLGAIELIDYLLDKMNELDGEKDDN